MARRPSEEGIRGNKLKRKRRTTEAGSRPKQLQPAAKERLPFWGMRTIKTLIAVYLCFAIGILRGVLPFYSAIAAILCMKKDVDEGKKAGIHRSIGTLIGGSIGLLCLLLFRRLDMTEFGWLHFLLITLGLVPVIYSIVALKAKEAVYIGCVVFLSVTVSHGGDEKPYLFAANRILDTFIGIVTAQAVNRILPRGREE